MTSEEIRDERKDRMRQQWQDRDRMADQRDQDRLARAQAREQRTGPFWGERYIVKRERTQSSTVWWVVWDTSGGELRKVQFEGRKIDAEVVARDCNDDPTANWNGVGWPKVHGNTPLHPLGKCDCQDPPVPYFTPESFQAPNVCGGCYGTYCASHGTHDECPRSVRALPLLSDPCETMRRRHEAEYRRQELERQLDATLLELERVSQMEDLAERFGK